MVHTLSQKKRKVKTGFGKKIDLGDQLNSGDEQVKYGAEEIKSGNNQINTGHEDKSIPAQREGKQILEEPLQPKKSKRQIREDQANMSEIARIKAQEEAEAARLAEIEANDAEIARKMQEELEPFEAKKKRMAEVQKAAMFYTEDD